MCFRIFVVVACAWTVALAGCSETSEPLPDRTEATFPLRDAAGKKTEPEDLESLTAEATSFCGDCHAMPDPASFSRERWGHEVQRGFDFYWASGRGDLPVPKSSEIRQYFDFHAPEKFDFSHAELSLDRRAVEQFERVAVAAPDGLREAMACAGLQVVDFGGAIGRRLVQADMRNGAICGLPLPAFAPNTQTSSNEPAAKLAAQPAQPLSSNQLLATLDNPCRLVACRLSPEDAIGLLVADLGSFLPADHARGRVVYLQRTGDTLEFTPIVLLANVGRVSDVQVADVDGDGDLDVVVAEFGWHDTGSLRWLENIAAERTAERTAERGGNSTGGLTADDFVVHQLDPRAGAMEVRISDLNGDGHPDIVCLFAQEFEELAVFLGDGQGNFEKRVLFSGNDPAYGSSGFEICDLNGDGAPDFLLTNGDSFDSFQAKPYHAVHWLENVGELRFKDHVLLHLPGAHRALAVDLDGDGDLDIIASSFMPDELLLDLPFPAASLVWLDNDGAGHFTPRALEVGTCTHPAALVADFDQDGLPDIAVGNFLKDGRTPAPALDLWLNRR